ncbi:MAG: hypothetical protein H0V44_02200 [Planctomycetes bacterium]|nr:hypothetical protein [Planctomycetota bacterium]
MLFGGIDEAGYGPLLGPLSIAAVSAACADEKSLKAGFRRARTGAKDSKQVHTSGDIAAIEAVALPAITWLTGNQPATASECFAAMGESIEVRDGIPWMDSAAHVALPVAAVRLKRWDIPGVEPRGLHGRLIQPREYNAAGRSGMNKADLELAAVGSLLSAIHRDDQHAQTIVDRLGGRRYYGDFLQTLWPRSMVLIETEAPGISSYRALGASAEHAVHFCVDGESVSPLTAVASCIAKYVRELHMLLLNRFWSGRFPHLRPSAGYGRDARRWLDDLGAIAERDDLVRVGRTETDDVSAHAIADGIAAELDSDETTFASP